MALNAIHVLLSSKIIFPVQSLPWHSDHYGHARFLYPYADLALPKPSYKYSTPGMATMEP